MEEIEDGDVVTVTMKVHTTPDMVGDINITFDAIYRGGKFHFIPGTVKEDCPPLGEMAVV